VVVRRRVIALKDLVFPCFSKTVALKDALPCMAFSIKKVPKVLRRKGPLAQRKKVTFFQIISYACRYGKPNSHGWIMLIHVTTLKKYIGTCGCLPSLQPYGIG